MRLRPGRSRSRTARSRPEPECEPAPAVFRPRDGNLDFGRGVEFGLLFARVTDYGRTEGAVHADMAELVIRLAESRGLPFSASPHEHGERCGECIGRSDCKDGGEWLDVTIGPA